MRKSQSSRSAPADSPTERLASKLRKAGDGGARRRAVADILANGTAADKAALEKLPDKYKS